MVEQMKTAVFCVGSSLLLDEGIGPAVYEQVILSYDLPSTVQIFDVGCMSMEMLSYVDSYDLMITVDALEGTDSPAGTVFRFSPDDMARRQFGSQSLHDMRLSDLFDAAELLGSSCEGVCLGMQVQNMQPAQVTVGLTPPVYEALPLLVDTLLAELVGRGYTIVCRRTGETVGPGFHHAMVDEPID